ncbi:MAG: hypothetical protein FWC30_00640 [Candidatus Bathyarchaeota archaeon]|nr:hypothetical protein [Candidatus Termiticorpusculum sp.]
MNPTASEDKLEALRALCVAQLATNEKRKAELSESAQPKQLRGTAYVDTYISSGPLEGTVAGSISNGANLKGAPNNTFAAFSTTYSSPSGQSIYAKCSMTSSNAGDVYVRAKKSGTGSANYAIVFRSSDWLSWIFVGYTLVSDTSSSGTDYWVGRTPAQEWLACGTSSMSTTTSPSNIEIDSMRLDY